MNLNAIDDRTKKGEPQTGGRKACARSGRELIHGYNILSIDSLHQQLRHSMLDTVVHECQISDIMTCRHLEANQTSILLDDKQLLAEL